MAKVGHTIRCSKILGLIVTGLIKCLGWLPLSVVRILANTYAYVLYLIPNESKRVLKANLQVAYPTFSEAEYKAFIKANIAQSSKTFAEIGAMWCWELDKLLPLIKEVHGQELLDAAFEQNKGVILISPHIGNWELLVPYLSSKYPATFLYRPPNVSSVEGFMVKSRNRFGGDSAPTDNCGVRKLMKALAKNHVSVILPDQDPGKTGGEYAPFFDRPVRTMTLLSKLVKKTQCQTLCAVMKRQPGLNGGFELHLFESPDGIDDCDSLVATTALNKAVEQCIEIAPTQYLWCYKRYRKPPEGVSNLYK